MLSSYQELEIIDNILVWDLDLLYKVYNFLWYGKNSPNNKCFLKISRWQFCEPTIVSHWQIYLTSQFELLNLTLFLLKLFESLNGILPYTINLLPTVKIQFNRKNFSPCGKAIFIEKLQLCLDKTEMSIIDKCFQNWGGLFTTTNFHRILGREIFKKHSL